VDESDDRREVQSADDESDGRKGIKERKKVEKD
jgi:hypothetical protein